MDGSNAARARLPRRLRDRALHVAAVAALLVFLASRVLAVYTANVHWDEFGQLATADRSLETGRFHGAGRPGLGVALLLPFVAGCDDEIEVARRARALWILFTLAYLAGLAALAARLQPDPARRAGDAWLAVGLLALVPAFLASSVQIRTDQIGLAGGTWGAVALLSSRRRPALAALAGLSFGIGWLATQKVVYVGALAGLLAIADAARERDVRPARDATRAGLALAAMAAVVAAFGAGIGLVFPERAGGGSGLPSGGALAHGFSVFEFYRKTIGTSQYRAMLPTLVPHGLLLAGLVAATASALRRRGRSAPGPTSRDDAARGRLALAWAVLALGLAVALFHAAAFTYFWMTLGIFPAVAFALARESIDARLAGVPARVRLAGVGLFAGALAIPAALALASTTLDAQAVQRESLRLVHRNFDRRDAGFQPESALFCQADPDPFPTYFSQLLYRLFAGEERERHTRALLAEFEERPVKFLVQSFRLDQFPVALRRYWVEHYQPYRASVSVAGRRLAGPRGARVEMELVVPGRYRWIPLGGAPRVAIDGRILAPGETLELRDGRHVAVLEDDVPDGMLVLALSDPPGPAPLAFYTPN